MKKKYTIGLMILTLIFTQQVFPQKENAKGILTGEQQIELSEGYSFISSRIIAEDPDMLIVMASVLNENLDFVRDSEGNMLRKIGPNWVNGIGNWIVDEGYLVRMLIEDSFIIVGDAIDPITPIQLETGYQFISYLPETSMDALIAYETILGDNLDFVRDSEGNMLRKIGPNWVNGIGDCNPGEGYLVKMFNDAELIYPPINQPPDQPSSPYPEDGAENQSIEVELSWTCTDPEGDPLTYDIYFGTEATPPQVAAGQTELTYDPGTLESHIEYFWKIVAHDDHSNTTEGPVWSFITEVACGVPFTDPRDGQTYNTALIGVQCWMAENLNVGTIINGSQNQQNNGTIEKYCYDNSSANCNNYGGLYQWNEMMQYITTPGVQGICPAGWHIPTDAEWKILEGTVDDNYPVGHAVWDNTGWRGSNAGYNLKSASNWNGNDMFGFSALPGGIRSNDGSFGGFGGYAYFYSSSPSGSNAWIRALSSSYTMVYRDVYNQAAGFSVRCLKDQQWQCGNPITDPRDQQIYGTVEIGEQCWIAENLNIGEMINGTEEMTDNSVIEKYCYGNNPAYCDEYGGLYQWNEMMEYTTTPGVQGICPGGWHLPTDGEWTTLTDFLGGESVAGGKMKETGTTHWNSPNTGATNESGFTALPGGNRHANGGFLNLGDGGLFWSSTENYTDSAWYWTLYYNNDGVSRNHVTESCGFSSRCLQD